MFGLGGVCGGSGGGGGGGGAGGCSKNIKFCEHSSMFQKHNRS